MIVQATVLEAFVARLLEAAGVPAVEAEPVAESLVGSNLRGHDSHGVVQLPGYIEQLRAGTLVPGAELTIRAETPSLLVADAGGGFGPVQMARVIERLIPKAAEQGVACGTLCASGHLGRIGEWVERVARRGVAALMAVNDNGVLQCVAPPGGTEPRISTNPVAIGVPTGSGPLVLDVSTSVVANGKVRLKLEAGESCPPGWLLDAEGNPTTDPSVRFSDPRGSLLPMGGEDGYKGFGLGLLFDVLVGGLSGGFSPPAPPSAPLTNNTVLVLWAPERFAGKSHFLAQADELLAYVRGVRRKPGVESIRLPGDRSAATLAERKEHGVPLAASTWQSLLDLADELGVAAP